MVTREQDTFRTDIAQVWCDVGGTFTDCFVRDAMGIVRSTKVLSHGRVPGRVEAWLSPTTFTDPARRNDPPEFWCGATIAWYGRDGVCLGRSSCIGSNSESALLAIAATPTAFDGTTLTGIERYELEPGIEAPVLAARWLLRVPLARPLPPVEVRLGTTRATNALLTRRGAPTALLITQGFADLLEIGYQERPELFAIRVQKREVLAQQILEVPERIAADGSILVELDVDAVRARLAGLKDQGIRSLAICLLHATRNPIHEKRVAAIAQEFGFECICVSHEVAPVPQAVARAETSVVDAYLTPVIRAYMDHVQRQFGTHPATQLRVMTSSGGLVAASEVRGRHTVLSGPAGGAVALQAMAKQLTIPRIIGLDMGGTSTDVCRIEGRLQLEHETIKAGVRMLVPTLAIHTVAAGGGSICWFDGVQLRVGPQSAGSDPGPAAYGRGGPLTITDLNLLHGRIDPTRFPIPLDVEAARARLLEVLSQVHQNPWFEGMDEDGLITGFRRLANEQMASAVRSISIEQGADPRDHALAGFGGAAGQHICEIAELLGMDRIVDHPESGLLSALGMGLAPIKRSRTHGVYQAFASVDGRRMEELRAELQADVTRELNAEGIEPSSIHFWNEAELRYQGTEGSIRVPWPVGSELDSLAAAFERAHQQRFGYLRTGKPLEWVGIWVEGYSSEPDWGTRETQPNATPTGTAVETADDAQHAHRMVSRGRWLSASRWLVSEFSAGARVDGPALIQNSGSTTIIEAGWSGQLRPDGIWILERCEPVHSDILGSGAIQDAVDPVLRDVLAQRIAAIADQMGIVLEQTAISVNVKQRRDFSCAVFDAAGELIANAPHVPVHLGAMGRTVKAMIEAFPEMRSGDCFVTNDPYRGGSHLPDVTVVTPVFADRAERDGQLASVRPDFFVASRAHHAEIGGIAPGSMAPTSKRLGEEGVVIPPMKLLDAGRDASAGVETLLRGGPYPSRSVAENMADLAAQQAANMRGAVAIQELAREIGLERLQGALAAILDAAEAKTRRWIESLEDRIYHHRDCMDDGTPIEVTLRKQTVDGRDALRIDFQGTGPTSSGNLNANPGIVHAAVLYSVRCAIADTMPLNSGVMRAIDCIIPEGILNPRCEGPQSEWPAVAGGNVETSQRIVDCLFGALGLGAASQGTMNNFLFGNAGFGYYETIGGGTGACSTGGGASAVHSHMTNTRLTDVEILESRYPVRLVKFAIRRGSGGDGRYRGGDGMMREVLALEPLDVSLVTGRRAPYRPFGMAGGGDGASGENWWLHRDGRQERLPHACQLRIEAGDAIRILTPGGGGFGNQDATSG